jgi:isoleucyl-tRNA synthetase
VDDEVVMYNDVEIRRAPKGENPNLSTHQLVSIEVDPTVTPEQVREGLAREIIRKVQAARKNADFNLDDRIALEVHCDGELKAAAEAHRSMISEETLAKSFSISASPSGSHVEEVELEEGKLRIGITQLTSGSSSEV